MCLPLMALSGNQPLPAAGSTTTPTTESSDEYFSNVVLLLHMYGTNGSNTFTDLKGKTVTPSGNAQISTAQSKFGGASGYFDGSGDSLSITKADLDISNAGDLTVEGFLYTSSSSNQIIYTTYNLPQGSQQYSAFLLRNDQFQLAGVTGEILMAPVLNQWQHIAVTRQGSTWRLFLEGVLQGSKESSASIAQAGSSFIGGSPGDNNIGNHWLSGYLDEFRITKGIARYTANFTPPTTPFPNN